MRLLFVKEKLAWPRSSGHDVLCYFLMRALGQLKHQVSLVTVKQAAAEALAGLNLAHYFALDCWPVKEASQRKPLAGLQERFRSYWGIQPRDIAGVAQAAQAIHAEAVVVSGLNVLPYLGGVRHARKVWYAADEWVLHHLSLIRQSGDCRENLKQAAIKGLYERVFAPCLDRVWVVSAEDRRAMRWVTGLAGVDWIGTGVDSEHYQPGSEAETDSSCIFWGRLDFGPNLQGLAWFCQHVWPELRRQVRGASLSIHGFQPGPEAWKLADQEGIRLVADLPDLRPEIARSAVVVLPFVSGRGIKNKLLEAASMGKAIVCSPLACSGLRGGPDLPLVRAGEPAAWVKAIRGLWADPERRYRLGAEARRWVVQHHSWQSAARDAIASLNQ